MALTTKSGALWQMSRAEKDEGWTDEGHAFVGREVVRSTSATAQSVGTIYCWLPPTVEDCYEDEDGKPAPLFKVRFLVGELDGDVEDLDIRQVVESLVTESVLRPPAPAPKPKPKAKKKEQKPLGPQAAAQAAEVRRLKEEEGLANADPRVEAAVAELLRLKAEA